MIRDVFDHEANHREIALIADHGDGPAYWALDPDTGRERLLFSLRSIPTPSNVQSPVRGPAAGLSITRDLSRLAIAYIRDDVPNIWTVRLDNGGFSGALVQRTFEKESGIYASWSLDGTWMAYQCLQGTDTNICVIGAEGGNRTQLTHTGGQRFIGGWAPDNDTILFVARRNAVWNVTSVSRSLGTVHTITSFTEPPQRMGRHDPDPPERDVNRPFSHRSSMA